jgi:hypothetical protein
MVDHPRVKKAAPKLLFASFDPQTEAFSLSEPRSVSLMTETSEGL